MTMEGNKDKESRSTFKKMTRSISFKFHSMGKKSEEAAGGSTKNGGKQPKKLDVNNWLKGKPPSGQVRKEKPPDNMRMFNSVGDKKSLWAEKVDSHNRKQQLNPFSDKFDASAARNHLSKDDPEYGRPDSNSLSAMRARAGEAKMRGEICDVCDVIFQHGQRNTDGTAAIMFGPLFQMYNRINDKLVGLLIRARRRDLLTFEGEMLYQRRDDETWIVLTKSINTIHAQYGRDTEVPGGGIVDPLVQATLVFDLATSGNHDLSKRGSQASVASLPTNISSQMAGCAGMLGATALAVAGINARPEFGRQNSSGGVSAPGGVSEKSSSTTSIGGKVAGKGGAIRESFRKLVKPLVKRRTESSSHEHSGEDGSQDEDSDRDISSRRNSRRGSRMSTNWGDSGKHTNPDQIIRQQMHDRLNTHRNSNTGIIQEEESGNNEGSSSKSWQLPSDSKWRKILGVSLAISRMSQMTKGSSQALDKTGGLQRAGSFG